MFALKIVDLKISFPGFRIKDMNCLNYICIGYIAIDLYGKDYYRLFPS